jgi:hypothetical protein
MNPLLLDLIMFALGALSGATTTILITHHVRRARKR